MAQTPIRADLSKKACGLSGPNLRVQREPARLLWVHSPEMPLDLQGPIGRPFERMGADFAGAPAIEHLRAVARKFADKIAVSDGIYQFTYAEFLARVLRLAQAIAAMTSEGEAVGSFLGISMWQPIAMLACMAAGRLLVPLNTRDPARRQADIAAAARISVLIGEGETGAAEWIESGNLRWIDIETISEQTVASPLLPPVSVDAPALVLYTSGSTGQPKGVVNSQRSLLQRVQQYVDACHTDATDVFMPLSGPTTIAGCREQLSALLTGARLHIVDVEALGLRGLRRQMRSQRVTITYIVPTLLRALANGSEPGDFESLRIVRIGGEKVLWTDIALVRKVVQPGCFIQVSYLSTETTGTQWFIPDDCEQQDVTVPVGYLLPGISFAVLDEDGKSVPIGDVGELVIKSRYVLLGYWDNGQLSRVPPDADDPLSRVFPTGDLVTIDARGLMRVVGRKGRQLKINGRRVEPAELETVLRKTPYVRDAVTIVTDANELVAFASSCDPARSTFTTDIRNVVRQTLPSALHPTRLHEIAEIPRTAGGKVDVARLKVLDLENRRSSPAPQLPAMKEMVEAKEVVQQVWTSILGTADAAGRWDEAGGDSLKLLRCVMDLEELTGEELNMQAFTVDMSAADMVDVLVVEARPEWRQRDAELLPLLVMLPGSMGYGPSLAAFGAQLSKVARVIPIRYPDLTATLAGCGSVDHMATLAMEQIKAAQPRGDIRLIGYSLGGGVAFELASRLIAEGRSVKFLGILDTNIGPHQYSNYREALSRTLQRIRSHRVTVYRMLCRVISKCVVRLKWQVPFCRLLESQIWTHLPGTRFILRLELEEILRMQAFDRWRAASKTRLPITGTVFACNRRSSQKHLGWDSVFAQLDVIPIAGGHLDLVVEPHVAVNLPIIQRAVAASYS
jgi:acyl-CoA synthetase (AMP-forming)/AMP-acid ligase II/thioesterase domain-containing protein